MGPSVSRQEGAPFHSSVAGRLLDPISSRSSDLKRSRSPLSAVAERPLGLPSTSTFSTTVGRVVGGRRDASAGEREDALPHHRAEGALDKLERPCSLIRRLLVKMLCLIIAPEAPSRVSSGTPLWSGGC